MSLDEFDAQAEDYNSSDSSVDLSYLAGIWYLDGDLDADSYIYIDSSGGLWGLYERAPRRGGDRGRRRLYLGPDRCGRRVLCRFHDVSGRHL